MHSHSAQTISPVLVGRKPELHALGRALEAAQRGQGRCVLIAGEAGVGKSRLLGRVRQQAIDAGFVILQGQCFEQDISFPYSLWINMLRSFWAWRSPSQVKEYIGPLAAELVKLLPEL